MNKEKIKEIADIVEESLETHKDICSDRIWYDAPVCDMIWTLAIETHPSYEDENHPDYSKHYEQEQQIRYHVMLELIPRLIKDI